MLVWGSIEKVHGNEYFTLKRPFLVYIALNFVSLLCFSQVY